ncbi:CHAT domain-containing protein [Laspinema olomoucense]|uniref:CHAT domain-containing protein n=1 Tax=Laspinema olomoucense TaxID=3231600 RepID=UPI0021BB1AB5|nr:CHAT domain-containing protein [Laspinema sp. D3d]MCT7975529.1 tetratricopeptide repeat protein [Laspinema sp. D3d]
MSPGFYWNQGLDSRAIAQTVEDRKQEADRLIQLGLDAYGRGQFLEVLPLWQEALTIYREIGNQGEEIKTLNGLGTIYLNLQDYSKAEQSYQQALQIARAMGDQAGEASILVSLGNFYENQGDYRRALEFLEPALQIALNMGNQAGEGNALLGLGNIYANLGDYSRALESLEQSLQIARNMGSQAAEGLVLSNLGWVYKEMADYPKAQESYEGALQITRDVGNPVRESIILGNLGDIYTSLGDYLQAEGLFQQSLLIFRQFGKKAEEGITLASLGKVYQNLGRYAKAEEYYKESLNIARQLGNQAEEGGTLRNLGVIANLQGNYPQAESYYTEALEIARRIGDKLGEGSTLSGLGNLYHDLGQYSQAQEYYQESLMIVRDLDNKPGEGDILIGLGNVYVSLGDYPQAEQSYEQSLQIKRELGDRPGQGNALVGLGILYSYLEDYAKAREYLEESLTIKQSLGDQVGEANSLHNLGVVVVLLKDYPNAEQFLRKALVIYQNIGDKVGEASVLHNLSNIYQIQGDYNQAEEFLWAAIAINEQLRPGLTDPQKISLVDQQAVTYEMLQSVLLAQNKIEPALEVSERGRARAFVELLAQRFAETPESIVTVAPPNLAQIRKIAAEQNATIVQYSQIRQGFTVGDKKYLEGSELYIWVIEPTGKISFRLTNLDSLLAQEKAGLVQFIAKTLCFENYSCLRNIRVRQSRGGSPEVIREGDLEANQRTEPKSPNSAEGKVSGQFRKLHEILIEPIADLLPSNPNERVIFVPHDSLFLVPFPALQDASGKYLIEKHTILTSPSIQVLEFTRDRLSQVRMTHPLGKTGEVLVVGNPIMPVLESGQLRPLPGSEQEAQNIGKLWNVSPVIGEAATKSRVVQQMQSSQIIHLATHGSFDSNVPLESWVALTPSGTDNGFLTAGEIFGLNLNAELVVLSACNTGRGKITGDGVVGLSRSFISAGVPSLLVSLWEVPDYATALLMQEFYQVFQENGDKAQALRQAMLTTMQQYPDPFEWAAFTLMGEAE